MLVGCPWDVPGICLVKYEINTISQFSRDIEFSNTRSRDLRLTERHTCIVLCDYALNNKIIKEMPMR